MPLPRTPVTRNAIAAALKDLGPMSVVELVEHLGLSRSQVNSSLTTARANHPRKLFRIASYRKQVGVQGRETPLYSAGPGPDARRPVVDKNHIATRRQGYYQRNRARLAMDRKRRAGAPPPSWLSGLIPMARRATKTIAAGAYLQSARG